MNMQKLFALVLAVILSLSTIACTTERAVEEVAGTAPAKRESLLEIEELSRLSSIVLVATVKEQAPVDDYLVPYSITIEKEIRGTFPSEYEFYFSSGQLEIGSLALADDIVR